MIGDFDEGFLGLLLGQAACIEAVGFEKLHRR
jgi:hypothetical protein